MKKLLLLIMVCCLPVVMATHQYISEEIVTEIWTDTGAACVPAGTACSSSLTAIYPVNPNYFPDETQWRVKTWYAWDRNISLNRSMMYNDSFVLRYNATHTTASDGVVLFEYYNGTSWVQLENETRTGTGATNSGSQLWNDEDFSTGSAWYSGSWRADTSTHAISRLLTFYEQSIWWHTGNTRNVTISVRDDFYNLINLALVNITRVADNYSYGAKYTDVSGGTLFELLNDESYYVVVTASDYNTFSGIITVIQDSYTIILTSNSSSPFYSLYKYLSFVTSPASTLLSPTDNQTFSVQANITNGSLIYFGLTSTFNGTTSTDNDTTSTGGTASIGVNTTGQSGKTINVSFFFLINGSSPILFTIPYSIYDYNRSNSSFFKIAQDFSNELSLLEKVGLGTVILVIMIILLASAGVPADWAALVSNIFAWAVFILVSWVPVIIGSLVILLSFGMLVMIARSQVG